MRGLENEVAAVYPSLSNKLRQAADFVISHPIDVATRSLRSISNDAGLAPVTFTRLARAAGFESYENLREAMRQSVSNRARKFSDAAEELQSETRQGSSFLDQHITASIGNLQSIGLNVDGDAFQAVVGRLRRARRVQVLGVMGSTGITEHLNYIANFVADNWTLLGRMGASLAGALVDLTDKDVLIVITKPPFAQRSINAVQAARRRGAYVLVITDTHACPALVHASASFITSSDSPHFFSSYVSTLALVEAIVGALAVLGGKATIKRIKEIENSNSELEYYQDQPFKIHTSTGRK